MVEADHMDRKVVRISFGQPREPKVEPNRKFFSCVQNGMNLRRFLGGAPSAESRRVSGNLKQTTS
jgi:hypothetical protein